MGVLDPFRFVLISIAGWMNQQQQQAIDYLREENRVLREEREILTKAAAWRVSRRRA